jgi:hypothetical protein
MDEWESVAVALQGVCVAFADVTVLASAIGVPGIVDPFAVAGALFALGSRSAFATWSGLTALAVAGLGLCYRAIKGYRRGELGASAS